MKTKKITVLLLSIVVFVSTLLISCGSGGSGSNSGSSKTAQKSSDDPGDVIEKSIEYAKNGDYKAYLLLIEGYDKMRETELNKQIKFIEQAMKLSEKQNKGFINIDDFEITKVTTSEDGNSATVTVKTVWKNGEEETGDTKLVKVNGKWKIKRQGM